MEETEGKTIKAVDISLVKKYETVQVAYYRISRDLRDFITLCGETHDIVGFEYTEGELNFGIILGKKKEL